MDRFVGMNEKKKSIVQLMGCVGSLSVLVTDPYICTPALFLTQRRNSTVVILKVVFDFRAFPLLFLTKSNFILF
jgi:hypothetical protein